MKRQIVHTLGCCWILALSFAHFLPSSVYSSDPAIEEKRSISENSTPVNAYLNQLKKTFQEIIAPGHPTVIHLVIGNEAADLDSICGSIARARCLSLQCTDLDGEFFPVVNIQREELKLRKDAKYLFAKLGIDERSVLFIDEVPLVNLHAEGRLKLHLVDHNRLAIHQLRFEKEVLSIVDHHADEEITYPQCRKEDKTIHGAGSATTLIAKELLSTCVEEIDAELASLLLAPILLDTVNLSSKYKTTSLDREVVEELTALFHFPQSEKMYRELAARRYDTSGMTTDMLLRRDKKHYQKGESFYAISSLPCGTQFPWQDDPSLIEAMHVMRVELEIPLFLVMGRESREAKRFLCLASCSQFPIQEIVEAIQENKAFSKFRLISVDEETGIAAFQMPRSFSRKKFHPLFQSCLKSSH